MKRVNEVGSATAIGGPPADVAQHCNDIHLIGEFAGPAMVRTLPSGDEVVAFRLTVRSAGPPGPGSRRRSAARSDSVECLAWRAAPRGRALAGRPGDLVQVDGHLRHRYWRGSAGLASRYEVEADMVKVLRRASG